MKRRHAMRRPNGVGAYHLYLGQLLKKAKLKGKDAAERKSLFKEAQAKAVSMARSKKFGTKLVTSAKSANAALQAKKAARRAKRAEKGEHITFRTARRLAGGMAAYRALKPKERAALRKQRYKRPGGASEKAKLAFKIAAEIAPKGSTKAQRNAAVKEAWALVKAGKTSARPSVRPSSGRPPSIRTSATKATSGKASGRKASGKASGRKAASGKASASKGAGFSGIKVGAKGRNMYFLAGKMVSQAAYKAARPGSSSRSSEMMDNPRRRRKGARKAHRKMGMMRRLRNTGEGVLAAEKSFYGNLVSVPGLVSVVGVGIAHGVVAPMVADYLAKMLPSRVDLPVVGSVGASNLAFTATGLVAGGALVGLGATVAKGQQGLLNKMAMLAVGGGALIDIVGLVMNAGVGSDMGAIDNEGTIYGAIDNDGNVYGGIDADGNVYGDVVSYGGYEYAGLMEDGTNVSYGTVVGSEYADAMPADAEDSGADFSVAEGQALVDGPVAWLKRFGKSPVRATGIRGVKSRHAGREGHRWGWLIKLVGMDKAQQIAALPPQQRLEVIAKLRKAALESLAASLNAASTQTTAQIAPAQNLLPAPQDTGLDLTGAVGAAGGAYGATMYAGGGY